MAPTPFFPDLLGDSPGFMLSQHGHKDMVEAAAFNTYGNRFALGSADGRIKVYDKIRDGTWKLCDTWGAHNAEVLEVHWVPSTLHPNLLASISYDGRFKLWAEDPSLPILSGRRFMRPRGGPFYEIRSSIPYLSFSLKHNPETRNTYLALLNRNSLLDLYENDEPENMESWNHIDSVTAGEKAGSGEEVSFKVRFDPNLEPSYNAIRQGAPRDGLGIIVASMTSARLWRTKIVTHDVTLGSGSSKELYEAADFKGHRALVRDVAWAPGSVRGFDIVATVCKDGFVRVFEVHTPPSSKEANGTSYTKYPTHPQHTQSRPVAEGTPRSGIGAGLATTRSAADARQHDRSGQVHHEVRQVGKLDMHQGSVWKCQFDEDGQLLGTCGDDGRVILWRRKPDGMWAESGELSVARGTATVGEEGLNGSVNL